MQFNFLFNFPPSRETSGEMEEELKSENEEKTEQSRWGFGRKTSQFKDKTVPPIVKDSIEDMTYYLDTNHLLKSDTPAKPIKSTHREWFLNEATILENLSKTDQATKKQLELILLQGYSKAATISTESSDTLNIQTSPFIHEDDRYHRSTRNALLDSVSHAFAKDMGIGDHELIPVDSPLINEVFARELPHPDLNLNITNKKDFENLIDTLLANAESKQFPQSRVLIDVSEYLKHLAIAPKEMKEKMTLELEDIVMDKVKAFMLQHPDIKAEDISDHLLGQLHLIAYTSHKGQSILLIPEFLLDLRFDQEGNALVRRNSVFSRHGVAYRMIDHLMSRSGFRVAPDQAKGNWLKLSDATTILQDFDIPIAKLATKGTDIPEVCKSFQEFMSMPVVKKFREISHLQHAAPYLKILPEATWALLNGLENYTPHGGVQGEFKNKGIEDLLQLSYFRMINAMNEAILRGDNQLAFQNQIELIQQEIQNILAVIQPYDDKALASAVISKLTSGDHPIVPANLEAPRVHLKASAMHGLSSILASVEAEKGNNNLSVAVLKDSYYESSGALEHAKTYQLHIVDGDKFNQEGIDKAFEEAPKQPIDLFVCEFHHNISTNKQSYSPEKILEQVKGMVDKGIVAQKFTIAIDTTIDLEKSREVQNFLADEKIQELIQEGRLNVVLLRSAQKFDMLGIDNYYGGLTTSINNGKSFDVFNQRMDQPQDQLRGLSYQGLAHIQRYGGANLDAYRLGIMTNTQRLYSLLPEKAIYKEGITNPMQVSQINDDRTVFLDIKFPNYPATASAFKIALRKFAAKEKLPFTTRPSFGFPNMNFTVIEDKKFRLNPGLESEQQIQRYQQFFISVQAMIDEFLADPTSKDLNPKELDEKLAAKFETI